MEENKSSQDQLAEESGLCPDCGQDCSTAEAEVTAPTEDVIEEAAEETAEESTEEAAEETAEESTEEASEQVQEETPAKAGKGKVAIAAICVVVVLAVMFVLILMGARKNETTQEPVDTTAETILPTIPADGNPDDVTCKGTYTVTDEEVKAAGDIVVATIGDAQLTNGQLQVYYWSMVNSFLNSQTGYMMMAYGMLDYSQPLDTQLSLYAENQTWQQYFLDQALGYWQMYQSLANAAQAEGLEMDDAAREDMDTLAQQLEETAQSLGMDSVEELLAHNLGPGATLEDYASYQELFYTGYPYYTAKTQAMVPTQEDLEAFFAENEESYAESGITKDSKYVNVRHILIGVEGGTTDEEGNTTYSDEEWETCRVKAQEILDTWLAGDKTEESFAALANEHSTDSGSNTNGGLYEITAGQTVPAFDSWCFDETRAEGDYDLVQTNYGYHVMYFVSSSPIWEEQAKTDWVSQQTAQMVEELTAANPMEVDYSAIKLGFIDLAA